MFNKTFCILLIFILFSFTEGFDILDEWQCPQVRVDFESDQKLFHFSFRNNLKSDRKMTWNNARKYCHHLCMELVTIENEKQWDSVKTIFFLDSRIDTLWTGGRRCSASNEEESCENAEIWQWDEPDLPAVPKNCTYCLWGETETPKGGGECLKIARTEENQSFLKWTEEKCEEKAPVVCQERKSDLMAVRELFV